jgi:transposase
MMTEDFLLWVGIDWGSRVHQVCVLDQRRRVLVERSVKHTGEAISRFADELVVLAKGDPTKVAASIETTWGAIIDTLLERGVAMFSINPKQLDRFRDRHTVAGAKDDRRDAFVLAYSLSTDTRLFRRLCLGDPKIVKLRELVRVHEDLTPEVVAHGNRLSEQLHRYYPQLLELGSVYTDRWLWELWELAPYPEKTQLLSMATVRTLLRRHRIRRLTADQVMDTLTSVPLSVAPGVGAACVEHITMLDSKAPDGPPQAPGV